VDKPEAERKAPLGMRERKKLRTKRHLEQVAFKLFLERGYEAVTVADIASEADVGIATFWRYYKSKEALLLADSEEMLEGFRETLSSRPKDEPILRAAVESMRQLFTQIDDDPDLFKARAKIANEAPSAGDYIAGFERRLIDVLGSAVSLRLSGVENDPRGYIFAAAALAAGQMIRREFATAGAAPSIDDWFERVERALRSVEPIFGGRI
jgi:AcrR family transcriptional regulator